MLAVLRQLGHVRERVVHPAHVPLVGEPQPALARSSRHARPDRRLFRDHDRPRPLGRDELVDALQQADRLEVLTPAVHVRDPLALLSRVISIQHRRDRIDAQSVEIPTLEPVQRAANQEVAHLVAPEVVDQRVPVAVQALAWIRVLVRRRAIEQREPVRIIGKVRRHPVEDHPEPMRMAGRDQAREPSRITEATRRRIHARDLIAPRSIERVLQAGQQLDVREAEIRHVGRKRLGERVPVEKP